jgi:hypothetical protein
MWCDSWVPIFIFLAFYLRCANDKVAEVMLYLINVLKTVGERDFQIITPEIFCDFKSHALLGASADPCFLEFGKAGLTPDLIFLKKYECILNIKMLIFIDNRYTIII